MFPAWWPAVVFGLPLLVLSLLVSGAGIASGRVWLPCVGALLAAPSALYLGSHPGPWAAALALPALHLLAALAVRHRRSLLAATLLLPNLAAAIFVAVLVGRNLT